MCKKYIDIKKPRAFGGSSNCGNNLDEVQNICLFN